MRNWLVIIMRMRGASESEILKIVGPQKILKLKSPGAFVVE